MAGSCESLLTRHAFFYTWNGDLVLVAAQRTATSDLRHVTREFSKFSSSTASSNVSDIYVSQDYVVREYRDGTVTLQVIASFANESNEPAIAVVTQAMRHCLMILNQIESELRVRYGKHVIRLDVVILFRALRNVRHDDGRVRAERVRMAATLGWPKWRHPP